MHDISAGLRTFFPHHFELAKLQNLGGVEEKAQLPQRMSYLPHNIEQKMTFW